MKDEELENIFNYINGVENEIEQIEDMDLYEYATNCIKFNEYASMENYKEFLEEKE